MCNLFILSSCFWLRTKLVRPWSFSADIIEAASDTGVTLRAQIRGPADEDDGAARDLLALACEEKRPRLLPVFRGRSERQRRREHNDHRVAQHGRYDGQVSITLNSPHSPRRSLLSLAVRILDHLTDSVRSSVYIFLWENVDFNAVDYVTQGSTCWWRVENKTARSRAMQVYWLITRNRDGS